MSDLADLVDIVDQVCDRIDLVDPGLQAFVAEDGRRERLRADAARLSDAWPDAANRPLLYGIPVGVKDIFHVAGLPTRAGSSLPPEVLTGTEASVVSLLRAAGALVVGKTVTAEFASFAPGPTRNPRDPARTPGGSSSGSAAAVAAGLVPLAIGTQTVGSVIRPAAFCGIVGFKPTYGRIPADGLIANAPSFDTVGMLTPDVAGMAVAAAVACPHWSPVERVDRRPVLGVPDGPYLRQATAEGQAAFGEQVGRLQDAGFAVRRVPLLEDITEVNRRNRLINLTEFARSHEPWFEIYADHYHPVTADNVREGRKIAAADYEHALRERMRWAAGLAALMEAEGVDLWIAPAAPGPAPVGLETTGDPVMNLPWTQARLPVIGLPAGLSADGMPLGMQFVARPNADETLLNWAPDLAAALAP